MEKELKASKKNKGMLVVASMLLIVLLLTGAGGYTLARYATQEKGTGKAEVASWAFQIDKEGAQTKTVDLASTVNKDTLTKEKIAPGTSGKFSIKLDAIGSDTGVDYTVAFTNEKNKPKNLEFSYNNKTVKSLGEIGEIKGTLERNGARSKIINVTWSWPYQTGTTTEEQETNDKIDTQNGISPLDYTFEIVAIGTQSQL